MSSENIERVVEPARWAEEVASAKQQGFGFFEQLQAVDNIGRDNSFTIICRLVKTSSSAETNQGSQTETGDELAKITFLELITDVNRDAPELDTISNIFAAASWYEREITDFFGVEFIGGVNKPLLNRTWAKTPLRKEVVLGARVALDWPGNSFDEQNSVNSRRQVSPPACPPGEVWGNRDPEQPPATAEEIVAAMFGGRRARRTRPTSAGETR